MPKNVKTEWEGLWFQREGVYSGKTIKKADIPSYARLIVRFNRYYEKDSSRPRFVYCFASGDSEKAITIEKTYEEYMTLEEMADRIKELEEQVENMYTYEQVQYAINRAAEDGARGYGWGDNIVSDYL